MAYLYELEGIYAQLQSMDLDDETFKDVAPHMGAWIEISQCQKCFNVSKKSHPTWVRGLKFYQILDERDTTIVAPHMGAWIEIFFHLR